MANYLDWYLVELRSRLEGKLSTERVEIISAEVESHLTESAKVNMATPGVSEERAMMAAIESFGMPDKVALAHLGERSREMFGIPRVWVVVGSALTAIYCWVYQWVTLHGYFDHFGETWRNGLFATMGSLALGLLFAACRGGYRSYRRELTLLTAATAVGLVFQLSFWIVGDKPWRQGFSRFHLSRDVTTAETSLRKLDRLEKYLRKGQGVFTAEAKPDTIPLEYRSVEAAQSVLDLPGNSIPFYSASNYGPDRREQKMMFLRPSSHISVMVDGRIFGTGVVDQFEEARADWIKNTPAALKALRGERQEVNDLLVSAAEARAGRLFFFNSKVYTEPIFWTVLFLPALWLVDTVAWAFARRTRAWPRVGVA